MHRPDTIIEIHRERVQDQTVGVFGGDKYTESVDGTGYSATATLDLTLDRVWFILDSQRRLWQEETDGESRDPLGHFAIDLVGLTATTFGSSAGDGRAMAGPGSYPTTTLCYSSSPENCSCTWHQVVPAGTRCLSVSPPQRTDDATCRWKVTTPTCCTGFRSPRPIRNERRRLRADLATEEGERRGLAPATSFGAGH
jgi:hypothetical protein